ncbi:uroporphyrinogen-III synthase [Paenibacillus phyllosphaerae]|uniref:Uroporphyrinogen-III synthase n=1 Tax=Paenibacillus phyllosphaerae TaxID=274593 RepID=A0A7W5FQD6_9BACL|nr:uroporphyrinogen-III synthase [Paenibacillus phyllosphaerae]MBB3113336.1 uroporphyrinogen-III synthase [Paenibacillus phyllosphaerae]
MAQLNGRKILIAGSQKIDEMSELIRKHGGVPVVRPLQGLTYADETAVDEDIRRLVATGADWLVFTTGIGFAYLRERAESLGLLAAFTDLLRTANVASRGYRTFAFLKNLGVQPEVIADDGSLRSVADKLAQVDLNGKRVWIQLHGQAHSEIADFVRSRGVSKLTLSLPYHYQPPEPGTLSDALREIQAGEVDAVCFTTRAQIAYLFEYAREIGAHEDLIRQFDANVLAVAVGKVTATGLKEEGVRRVIVPDVERLGGMLVEIARYYEKHAVSIGT